MTDSTIHDDPAADEVAPSSRRFDPGRRTFLAVTGVAAAGVVLVACGGDDSSDDAATTTTAAGGSTTTTAAASGDAAIAGFAAGLELLAAQTYTAALDAATKGSLGEVPPAVAEYAKTAQAQHQEASDALAKAAGGITPEVPADIKKAIDADFAKVKDVPGLAQLALDFELKAASTYLDVLPKLESKEAIDLAGSILPITRQRAAILLFALGKYPVPETFASTDGSLAPS